MDLEDLLKQKDEFLKEIINYENVVILSHDYDDMDNLASKVLMQRILKETGVNNTYIMQDSNVHWDVRALCKEFDWKFHDKDHPLLQKPDALVLVDTHLHDNLSIPRYDNHGETTELDLATVPIYCFDHHTENEKSIKDIEYKLKIIEPDYNACVSLIHEVFIHESRPSESDAQETKDILQDLFIDKELSTAIVQALYIDTDNFMNMDIASERLYRLAQQKNIIKLNEQLRVKKTTRDEAKTWSRVLNPMRWIETNGLATICYFGEPKADIRPQAADYLVKTIEGTMDLSLVAGAFIGSENLIKGSVRARSDNQPVTADKLAKLFNVFCDGDKCGGKPTQAYIEIDTGMLRYSLDTRQFMELFLSEADGLVSSSNLPGAKRRDELSIIVPSKKEATFEEMLTKDSAKKSPNSSSIYAKSQHRKIRSNGRYITIGINLFDGMSELDQLGEYDLWHVLRLNEITADMWGSKEYMEAKSNLLYGMISKNLDNDSIVPYLLAVHSYREKNGNEKEEFMNMFPCDHCRTHTLSQVIDDEPLTVDVYRLPLMRINFKNNLIKLQRCAYDEVMSRIKKVLD